METKSLEPSERSRFQKAQYRSRRSSKPSGTLPEAIELPDRGFVLGVQWHPEVDETSRLIASLVEEARARMEGREPAQAPAAG